MDIHSKFAEFLDEHAQKFSDSEYKDMIELIAGDRKRQTKFYRVTVMLPLISGTVMSWDRYTTTVAMNEKDLAFVKASQLIHTYMLFGRATVSAIETVIFDIVVNNVPVVAMTEIDHQNPYKYLISPDD